VCARRGVPARPCACAWGGRVGWVRARREQHAACDALARYQHVPHISWRARAATQGPNATRNPLSVSAQCVSVRKDTAHGMGCAWPPGACLTHPKRPQHPPSQGPHAGTTVPAAQAQCKPTLMAAAWGWVLCWEAPSARSAAWWRGLARDPAVMRKGRG
jgi:hypothetical protein